MSEFGRRTFLKFLGGSTALLGMGISRNAWARTGGTKTRTGSGKVLETDVAIIGGGSAGMAAAAAAAESGVRVTAFEKSSELAFGGNGPFAVESRAQRQRNMTFTKEDIFQYFMKHTHYRADARLVKAYLDKSASTMDWLEERGAVFGEPIAYIEGGYATWHMKDRNSPRITDTLADRAKKMGAMIHLETPAKEILRDNGRIVGLIAEDRSGEPIQVKARAVIVATGGFSESAEWVKRYTGYDLGRDLFLMDNKQLCEGDGLRMAWAVGAAETEMHMASYRGLPDPYGGAGGASSTELYPFRQPNLMVNLSGERFVNEEIVPLDGACAGNAVHKQKNGCAFTIFDEAARKYYEEASDAHRMAMPGIEPMTLDAFIKKAQSGEGYKHLFMTDTLEELCVQTGIDVLGLRKTIEEYNKACDRGRDELFYKKAKYLLPVKQPKFYAARFFLNAYVGLGGMKINHKTEVLTKNFEVIPGLYAAGNDANTLSGDTYVFALAGHMSGFAYNTGRIAGENAVEYIKSVAS